MSARNSCALLLVLAACGGSSDGGIAGDPSGGSSGGGGGSGAPPPATTPPGTPPAAGGPQVTVRVHGSTAAFANPDGFSGETPTRQIVAIKSLRLLRTPDDPSPVVVFDLGASPKEADLLAPDATEVAKVTIATLPAGVFTRAKVGVSYVRYSVGATLHSDFGPVVGRYDNEQALSDGAILDGMTRKKGYFRYSFAVDTTTYGTLEGDNAPTPVATSAGGISMDMSGPETFYAFPVGIAIDPTVSHDQDALFEVNVDKSFRWQDQDKPGYAAGVFDTTATEFEPVMAFGANSFVLTLTP
jgi:hypothetical protein